MTPPRAGLSREVVLDAASAVVDEVGSGALSLKAIADSVGVRPPSLYNHVDGLEDVRAGLRLRAYQMVDERQRAAVEGVPPRDWVRALAREHRRFAREHPGMYAAIQPSAHRPDTDPEIRRAAESVLELLLEAVGALGASGDDGVHAVRAFRSGITGFIALETAGHFGMAQDVEASFDRLVEILERGIEAQASRG